MTMMLLWCVHVLEVLRRYVEMHSVYGVQASYLFEIQRLEPFKWYTIGIRCFDVISRQCDYGMFASIVPVGSR